MSYAITNLREVEDMAAKHGFGELQASRFPRTDVGMEDSGLAYHAVKPGKQQPFGHRHKTAEEIHVIISGSGRVKLDDELVEVKEMDVIRVAPEVTRAFEAGPDGLEYLVFSPRRENDSDMVPGRLGELESGSPPAPAAGAARPLARRHGGPGARRAPPAGPSRARTARRRTAPRR